MNFTAPAAADPKRATATMFKGVVCSKLSSSAAEGVEAIAIKELPRPTLDNDEVRVGVRSASINFPELLMMQGKYQYKPAIPFVLCSEGAGVVLEVGGDVTKFKTGDRVFFTSGTHGACAEEFVTSEDGQIFLLPESLTFSQGTHPTILHRCPLISYCVP